MLRTTMNFTTMVVRTMRHSTATAVLVTAAIMAAAAATAAAAAHLSPQLITQAHRTMTMRPAPQRAARPGHEGGQQPLSAMAASITWRLGLQLCGQPQAPRPACRQPPMQGLFLLAGGARLPPKRFLV